MNPRDTVADLLAEPYIRLQNAGAEDVTPIAWAVFRFAWEEVTPAHRIAAALPELEEGSGGG